MKRGVLLFVLLCAALIALMMLFASKPFTSREQIALETNGSPSESVQPTATVQPSSTPNRSTNKPVSSGGSGVPVVAAPSKAEQMKQGLATLNDEEIVLHGQVVDQFGSPVSAAAVTGSIQVNNGSRVGHDKVSVVTDERGAFHISGYRGKALGINVTKTGYVLATTKTRFVYSLLWPEAERYVPDSNNPAIIKMWKIQGAEPLVGIDRKYKIKYTNGAIYFDFLTGQIVSNGGDLKITVNRPMGDVSERNMQDWSIQIEPVDGGLIASDRQDAVTYAAPENGYEPNKTFIFSTNSPHKWSGNFNEGFFIKSRNDQVYSKVGISFGINQKADENMYINLSGVANPNHSRNWEATAQ